MTKQHKLEIKTECVDATYGGILGGRPDPQRTMARGVTRYYVDDVEVTKEEYDRVVKSTHRQGN